MADQKKGRGGRSVSLSTGPHFAPIDDPAFAEGLEDDLAADAAEGLHLTRDPREDDRQLSEPGIRLDDLELESDEKEDKKRRKKKRTSDKERSAQDG